jgi:pilus assembly protein CpaB
LNRRALIFVLTGLAAAVAAGIVVYLLATNLQASTNSSQTNRGQQSGSATAVPTRVVIVAARDIAANTVVSTSHLMTASYPLTLIPEDAIVNQSEVLNTTTTTPVFSGQILLRRQFLAAQGRTGASVNIPPGKVLVAFPSTDMLNATGAVQSGDHVDIMLSIPISGTARLDSGADTGTQLQPGKPSLVTQGTLQNIEVYTVGQWLPPGQTANAEAARTLKIITFVVDHQEALILKFVKDSGGTIDLAVRSAADDKQVQTDPVTLDYLVDLYGFIGLGAPIQPAP